MPRKPNPSFMKPMQPSQELSEVVGAEPLPRTEVVKKMWVYIKANNLQDPQKRTMINADEKLLPLFEGKAQISMFEMNKFLRSHLKAC